MYKYLVTSGGKDGVYHKINLKEQLFFRAGRLTECGIPVWDGDKKYVGRPKGLRICKNCQRSK